MQLTHGPGTKVPKYAKTLSRTHKKADFDVPKLPLDPDFEFDCNDDIFSDDSDNEQVLTEEQKAKCQQIKKTAVELCRENKRSTGNCL